jgi:hypothetical protein
MNFNNIIQALGQPGAARRLQKELRKLVNRYAQDQVAQDSLGVALDEILAAHQQATDDRDNNLANYYLSTADALKFLYLCAHLHKAGVKLTFTEEERNDK